MAARSVVAVPAAIAVGAVGLLFALAPPGASDGQLPPAPPAVPTQPLSYAVGYPPSQLHALGEAVIDNLLLTPLGSCGVIRLPAGAHLPSTFRECMARALRAQTGKQLTLISAKGTRTVSTYLRSYPGHPGLWVWTATSKPGKVATWAMYRCPAATGLTPAGACRQSPSSRG